MVGLMQTDNISFQWGKKKGLGVNRSIAFYYSFTLDGVHYHLYDAVYMFDERENDPHIGLIVKLWENHIGTKRVKVLWLFRPREISNFIKGNVAENELFLASGEGLGLTNINPLEAVSGKCNVVWIDFSSTMEINSADYFVRRVFDVNRLTISEQIDDTIAGIQAKFLLSRIGSQVSHSLLKNGVKEQNDEVVDLSRKIPVAMKETGKEKSCDTVVKGVDINGSLEISKSGTGAEKKDVLISNDEKANEKPKGVLPSYELAKKRRENVKANETCSKKQKLDISMAIDIVNSSKKAVRRSESYSLDNQSVDSNVEKESPLHDKCNDDELQKPYPESNLCKDIDAKKIPEKHKFDKSKWFKIPWDERMKLCNEQGRLVLICNFDNTFSGSEVEDLIRKAFNLSCSARIIPQIASSSPNFGQAFITFTSRKAAESVVTKLADSCLLLPSGRPVVARFVSPCFSTTDEPLCGHFILDKIKYQLQRDMKVEESTCHLSQPNTVEFEMAKEWCLLHERSDIEWKYLFKHQWNDLRNLKAA